MFKFFFVIVLDHIALVYLISNYKEESIKNCVSKVLDLVFEPDDTLCFIFDPITRKYFPNVVKNPHVTISADKKVVMMESSNMLEHRLNFVIYSENDLTLRSSVPDDKFIFITALPNAFPIFRAMWMYGNVNVVVVLYNMEEVRIFTSNPQDFGNDCGRGFDNVQEQNCTLLRTISFPKIYRKYNNCEMASLYQRDWFTENKLNKFNAVSQFVFKELEEHFQMNLLLTNNFSLYAHYKFKFSSTIQKMSCTKLDGLCTISFFIDEIVIMVPMPQEISPIKVLKIVFKNEVWILILGAFFFTSFAWWLAEKLVNEGRKFPEILLKVYQTTLFGGTSNAPKHTALRIIFMVYIIYSVHIQTAFMSNLVRILTIPQLENDISSIKKLVDSNLPVIADRQTQEKLFRSDDYKDPSFKAITKALRVVSNLTMESVDLNKSALVGTSVELENMVRFTNNTVNYFKDDVFFSKIYYPFLFQDGFYFLPSLNAFLTILIESGLLRKEEIDQENVSRKYNVFFRDNRNDDFKIIALTINHLISIFLFWVVGLILSTIAFIVENVTHFAKH
ncbi:hypothetical protein FQR65_LT05845 [Abscondita terminalis]|nr:hypothetical protein FQR65_LT05845 [Abscondita terminalis]